MKRGATVLTAIVWLAVGAAALGQSGNEAQQIRAWYRQYLQREPGPELQAWSELLRRGTSAAEVQAAILGSDEYFARCQQNADRFVVGVFLELLGRQPTAREQADWRRYYDALAGDRVSFVRGFFQSFGPEIQSGAGGASASQLETANQLAVAARLLVDNVNLELAGTTQGRQLVLRGNALVDALGGYRDSIRTGATGARAPEQTLSYAEMAYQAVLAELNNPPGTAPASGALARRIGDLLSTARGSFGSQSGLVPVVNPGVGSWPVNYPPATPTVPSVPTIPATPSYNREQVAQALDAVERSLQSLLGMQQQATSQQQQTYAQQVLLRDLQGLWSTVRQLRTNVDRLTPLDQLRPQYQQVRDYAARIEPALLGNNPFLFTRTYWRSVTTGLDQVGTALAAGGMAPAVNWTAVLQTVDRSVSELDAFLIRLTPLVVAAPNVAGVHSEAQRLRNQLLTLRAAVAGGSNLNDISAQTQAAVAQYQRVSALWQQFAQTFPYAATLRLDTLAQQIDQLNRMVYDIVVARGRV